MILERMANETGVHAGTIFTIVRSADKRYRTYKIDKRNGKKRQISQPSKRLKFVQRWLVKRIFVKFPVHECATAYKRGYGIAQNALPHASSKYLLKVDFREFFTSITFDDIRRCLLDNLHLVTGLTEEDAEIIAKAVCFHGALTIGAPSSPILSNMLLFDLDNRIHEYCTAKKLRYTRYADDIAISSSEYNGLEPALEFINNAIKEIAFPRLTINDDKTIFLSKKHKRFVTGLTLTTDGKISIGRRRKREIKSLIFDFKRAELDQENLDYLKGWIAYINAVEPEFNQALRSKYGERVLSKLIG